MVKTRRITPSEGSVSRVDEHRASIGTQFREADQCTKIKEVLPAGPTVDRQCSLTKRSFRNTRKDKLSFFDAFGSLGVPMVAILVLCCGWTVWLVFVSLAPNEAANWLMNTGAYDNGEFWLITDPSSKLTWAGVVCMVLVAACYLFVTLKMLLWREKILTPAMVRQLETRLLDSWDASRMESRTWSVVISPSYNRIHSIWTEFTSFNGKKRKIWNTFTKAIDLTMQTVVFLQLLKRGSPKQLVYGYAVFMAVNSLSCAINILADPFSILTEVLIDSIFDLSAAVLFPIVTLVFCSYNFKFDREVHLTYLEKLLPGSFEYIARLFADQSEIALFRVSGRTVRTSDGNIIPLQHQTAVPKFIGALFAGFSVSVVVVAQLSVSHSIAACATYPECVVHAYRWATSDTTCPCIIFTDVNKAPKTYEEWINSPDAYNALKAASTSGRLESIQVINRQLIEFPEELRLCHDLKSIQLMYTSTQNVPAWVGQLKHLEMLHFEGKMGSLNLRELPDNLFSNMPSLAIVHLGTQDLNRIPPLTGVPHLQTLSLAWMFQLHQLPSFDRIPDLRRLVISVIPYLEWIPDMSSLRNVIEFTILPGTYCCNGFKADCNLSDFYCAGNSSLGIPRATCLVNDTTPTLPITPYLGSAAAKAVFGKFAPDVCYKWSNDAVFIDNTPTKKKVDMCGGKPFRECYLPGNVTGICCNMRFQVLSCINDNSRIELRKYQIQKGVGPVCDPVEEKWLGCEK